MTTEISVIIATHCPNRIRISRTLAALRAQTLATGSWETIVVDNASRPAVDLAAFGDLVPANARVVIEPQLGLSHARRRGFAEAQGDIAVLVDDDNLLVSDYLAHVRALFAAHPRVGAIGGRSLPEFECPPPEWTGEFHDLLALRDLGTQPLLSSGLHPAGAATKCYPRFAPVGAGMAIRRTAWTAWLQSAGHLALSDRRGAELTSAGDNDIILCSMEAGWEVGYFPELSLTHLIPASRMKTDYLARLNRGIQKSWVQVLARHDANPWGPISRAGARLRMAKAWLDHRAWRSPAARIRWQGACGHFEGRATPTIR